MHSGKVMAVGTKAEVELKLSELTREEEVMTTRSNQPKEKCKQEVAVVVVEYRQCSTSGCIVPHKCLLFVLGFQTRAVPASLAITGRILVSYSQIEIKET